MYCMATNPEVETEAKSEPEEILEKEKSSTSFAKKEGKEKTYNTGY